MENAVKGEWSIRNITNQAWMHEGIREVFMQTMSLEGIVNDTIRHAKIGRKWWSQYTWNSPFGSSNESIKEYLSNGTHWTYLTKTEETINIIAAFADSKSNRTRRLVMHTYNHPDIWGIVESTNLDKELRAAVIITMDTNAASMWPQQRIFEATNPVPDRSEKTMVIVVETLGAAPIRTKGLINRLVNIGINRANISEIALPWTEHRRTASIYNKPMEMGEAETEMTWYLDNPASAWGKNKEKNKKQLSKIAMAMGFLPDALKSRLENMGYDRDIMNAKVMKKITKTIQETALQAFLSHTHNWPPLEKKPTINVGDKNIKDMFHTQMNTILKKQQEKRDNNEPTPVDITQINQAKDRSDKNNECKKKPHNGAKRRLEMNTSNQTTYKDNSKKTTTQTQHNKREEHNYGTNQAEIKKDTNHHPKTNPNPYADLVDVNPRDTQEERETIETLREKNMKIEYQATDGNCMFRCISQAVDGHPFLHTHYRERCLDRATGPMWPTLEPYMTDANGNKMNRSSYRHYMRLGEWGGYHELRVMAEDTARIITIWTKGELSFTFYPTGGTFTKEHINVSYHGHCHYNLLVPITNGNNKPELTIWEAELPPKIIRHDKVNVITWDKAQMAKATIITVDERMERGLVGLYTAEHVNSRYEECDNNKAKTEKSNHEDKYDKAIEWAIKSKQKYKTQYKNKNTKLILEIGPGKQAGLSTKAANYMRKEGINPHIIAVESTMAEEGEVAKAAKQKIESMGGTLIQGHSADPDVIHKVKKAMNGKQPFIAVSEHTGDIFSGESYPYTYSQLREHDLIGDKTISIPSEGATLWRPSTTKTMNIKKGTEIYIGKK
jgi:hypothetical protein